MPSVPRVRIDRLLRRYNKVIVYASLITLWYKLSYPIKFGNSRLTFTAFKITDVNIQWKLTHTSKFRRIKVLDKQPLLQGQQKWPHTNIGSDKTAIDPILVNWKLDILPVVRRVCNSWTWFWQQKLLLVNHAIWWLLPITVPHHAKAQSCLVWCTHALVVYYISMLL